MAGLAHSVVRPPEVRELASIGSAGPVADMYRTAGLSMWVPIEIFRFEHAAEAGLLIIFHRCDAV